MRMASPADGWRQDRNEGKGMRVFYCTDHDGYYPVGVASIVVAPHIETARMALASRLDKLGLDGDKPFTLTELDLTKAQILILRDGNY